jgi:hypothetical protein
MKEAGLTHNCTRIIIPCIVRRCFDDENVAAKAAVMCPVCEKVREWVRANHCWTGSIRCIQTDLCLNLRGSTLHESSLTTFLSIANPGKT